MMNVHALDETNIDEFPFLVTKEAASAIRRKEAQGLCVEDEGAHVGAITGQFVTPDEYKILSFYVLPEARNRGVGELLLASLAEIFEDLDVTLVLSFAALTDDERQLQSFLEYHDFEEGHKPGTHMFCITLGDLAKTKLKIQKSQAVYPSFSELSEKQLKQMDEMKSKGFIPKPVGGFSSKDIDRSVSTAVLQDGKPIAYAVVEAYEDKFLSLSALFVRDPEQPTTLLRLLRSVAIRAMEKYKPETKFVFPTVNKNARLLFEGLFEEGTDLEDLMYTYRKFLPGTVERPFDDMSFDEFLAEQREEIYGSYDDPEGAYLTA